MNQEMEFAARLEKIKRLAKEQGGLIQEKQVRDAFADMHFEEDQMKLVFDYLAGQNIGIGEPLNPEDYLSQEEINYLDSYLESLTGLDELSSGEKEAVTLSAMAGDADARRRLTEIFLPQVVDIAKLYAGQGALLEDLIGEGNVALAMAVEMLETAGNASEAEGLIGSMIMEAMENHRVKIGLEDGGEVFQYGLLELEQRLPADRFLRCHKSYLVNMDHVKRMEKTSFIMDDGRRIPIGRTYQKICREAVFGHVTKAEQDRT